MIVSRLARRVAHRVARCNISVNSQFSRSFGGLSTCRRLDKSNELPDKYLDLRSKHLHCLPSIPTDNEEARLSTFSTHLDFLSIAMAYEDVNGALPIFTQIVEAGLVADVLVAEKFIQLAATNFNVEAIELIMSSHHITTAMLNAVVEPLVMSGQIKMFANYLHKFCLEQSLPTTYQVAKVVQAYEVARHRRNNVLTLLTDGEVDAINDIFAILEKYHVILYHLNHTIDLYECPSARALLCLRESEQDMLRIPTTTPFKNQHFESDFEEGTVPKVLRSKLLTEQRYYNDNVPMENVIPKKNLFQFNDLTFQLGRGYTDKGNMLFHSHIFPGAFEKEDFIYGEMKLAQEINKLKRMLLNYENVIVPQQPVVIPLGDIQKDGKDFSVQAVITQDTSNNDSQDENEDDVDDEDEDEDEDDDMDMSSTVAKRILDGRRYSYDMHNQGYSVAFPDGTEGLALPDISEQINKKYPGYFLDFEEAIFCNEEEDEGIDSDGDEDIEDENEYTVTVKDGKKVDFDFTPNEQQICDDVMTQLEGEIDAGELKAFGEGLQIGLSGNANEEQNDKEDELEYQEPVPIRRQFKIHYSQYFLNDFKPVMTNTPIENTAENSVGKSVKEEKASEKVGAGRGGPISVPTPATVAGVAIKKEQEKVVDKSGKE